MISEFDSITETCEKTYDKVEQNILSELFTLFDDDELRLNAVIILATNKPDTIDTIHGYIKSKYLWDLMSEINLIFYVNVSGLT